VTIANLSDVLMQGKNVQIQKCEIMDEYVMGFYIYSFIYLTPRNTRLFQYNLLIIDPKKDNHYNRSEEAKLFSPAVTAHLQTRNIRIWPTS
jgi:hypothetical protein